MSITFMSLDLIQLFSSFFLLMNEWKHFENFYLTVNLHLKPDAVCWSLSFMSLFFPVVTLFKLFSDFYFDIVVQTQYSEGHCYQLASSTKQTG